MASKVLRQLLRASGFTLVKVKLRRLVAHPEKPLVYRHETSHCLGVRVEHGSDDPLSVVIRHVIDEDVEWGDDVEHVIYNICNSLANTKGGKRIKYWPDVPWK